MDNCQEPFFSVCIPNYNHGSYIGDTIKSVLSQTFQDFEVIIADNCSTDASIDVIKSIQDSRIKIIENRVNVGMSRNLDIVTKNSTGIFIILLSSDDLMKPSALESYYNVINNYNGDKKNLVLFSAFDIIDESSKIVHLNKRAMNDQISGYFNSGFLKSNELLNGFVISGSDAVKIMLESTLGSAGPFCTTCYSKELYSRVEGYSSSTSLFADATFIHKLGLSGAYFYYSNNNLFQYRNHGGNNLSEILKMSNIKLLIDNYLITQSYDDNILSKVGLSKYTLEETFINHVIFETAFWSFLRGQIMRGFRHLAFGMAAYPSRLMCNLKFLLLLFMLVFSPFFGILYRVIKRLCIPPESRKQLKG